MAMSVRNPHTRVLDLLLKSARWVVPGRVPVLFLAFLKAEAVLASRLSIRVPARVLSQVPTAGILTSVKATLLP